jgi:hypothetical protein
MAGADVRWVRKEPPKAKPKSQRQQQRRPVILKRAQSGTRACTALACPEPGHAPALQGRWSFAPCAARLVKLGAWYLAKPGQPHETSTTSGSVTSSSAPEGAPRLLARAGPSRRAPGGPHPNASRRRVPLLAARAGAPYQGNRSPCGYGERR